MSAGWFEPQPAVDAQMNQQWQQQQQQQRPQEGAPGQAPWPGAEAAAAIEWQQREAGLIYQLERHYWEQQEAEYQAGVAEYYAARRQHQAVQQRLNQVLYGHCPAAAAAASALGTRQLPAGWGTGHSQQHHRQQAALPSHDQQQQQQGSSGGGMDCCMALSPRPPLAAHNHLAAGMQWEPASWAAGVGASGPRKRGQEALTWVEEQQGGPDPAAFKRRAFRQG